MEIFSSKDKTILLVDDTKENVNILMGLLDAYDLLVALDGQTALELAGEEEIDLILLDIMMPGMDGFQVCETLKQHDITKDIPIIFITVKDDEDTIEKAFDIGGVDYITKPFKPKELLARVKTQLMLHSLLEQLKHVPKEKTKDEREFLIAEKRNELFAKLHEAVSTKRPKHCDPVLKEFERYILREEDRNEFMKIRELIKQYNFKQALVLLADKNKGQVI